MAAPQAHAPTAAERRFEALLVRVLGPVIALLRRTRVGRFLIDCVLAARAVAHGFRGEKISLRASALTYITMLSTVPLLTVAFAIVRAVGAESLRHSVHDFLFTNLAPGARESTNAYIDNFIERANAGAMGGVGGVFLLVSAISLLNNIEVSLNDIWGVQKKRFIGQRIVIYWCILTLGPVALGVSLVMTGAARAAVEQTGMLPTSVFALIPYFSTIFLFTFLYFFAPNAKVRFRAALGGAFVAGTAWEFAKYGYAHYATKSMKYDAIYGSVGQIPAFLLWVYVSWMLVLFGARLAYALQHAAGAPSSGVIADARIRETLCARVALEAAVAFLGGHAPPEPKPLAERLGMDELQLREAVRVLREAGILAETQSGALVPGKAPEQIHLLDIARAAGGVLFSHTTEPFSKEPTSRALSAMFAEADRAGRESLAAADLATLARPLVAAPVAEKRLVSNG